MAAMDSDDDAAANAEAATAAAAQNVEGDSPREPEGEFASLCDDDDDDNNNDIDADADSPTRTNRTTATRRYRSLACAPTTPCLGAILISIIMLATHVLFYYAQTAPMWKLHISEDIHVWANATSKKAKWAFDTLGVPHHNAFDLEDERNVAVFTYPISIRQLWNAKGFEAGALLSRTTAVLLVFCSGIWPHLKLFLLHCTWLFPMRSVVRRQRFLHWLSTLGKWSLADVLSVCVMLAVVDVEWTVDPAAVKHGLLRQAHLVISLVRALYTSNDVCETFLGYKCQHPTPHKLDHLAKCRACKALVHDAYTHPDWVKDTGKVILDGVQTSGGGVAQLSVVGMRGIYAFCIAVILSILLSLIVDVFDMRARRAQRQLEREQQLENNNNTSTATTALLNSSSLDTQTQGLAVSNGDANGGNHGGSLYDPLLAQHRLLDGRRNPPPVPDVYFHPPDPLYLKLCKNIYPVATLAVVLAALLLPTMVRRAEGAFPTLLHEIVGIDWDTHFSVQSLVAMTGLAGGWDILLRSTCSLFIILGPTVRALLCILDFCGATPDRFRRPLMLAIDFIGAFCAWEVIFVSIIMTGLLLPDITSTIVHYKECKVVSEDGVCFKLYFTVDKAFMLVAVGGFLLVAESVYAVYTGKRAEVERENDEFATTSYYNSNSNSNHHHDPPQIKVDEEVAQQYQLLPSSPENVADNSTAVRTR